MDNSLTLLQELLPELAAYAQTASAPTLPDFAAWLHRRTAPSSLPAVLPPQEPAYLNRLPPLTQLGVLVNRVQHFSQQQAQQLLAGLSPIATLRDFMVLAAITNNQHPTKSEVAAMCLLELSTITEISRRLIQAGLVIEVPDPHDRRTRRLQPTPIGHDLLRQAGERMAQLHPALYASLSPAEQQELRRLLSIVNGQLTTEFMRREQR